MGSEIAIFLIGFGLMAGIGMARKLSPIVSLGGGLLVGAVLLAAIGPRHPVAPRAQLTDTRPVVAGSSDHTIYKEAFAEAAKKLVDKGECTLGDFTSQGGWLKSTTRTVKDTYFVYCGGTRPENRVFLEPQTGETYRTLK